MSAAPFGAALPPWLPERVLAHDAELLVVDKPPGMPVHGGSEHLAVDVVRRLAAFAPGELFVHQRLDVGTSGVLAFVRDAKLNAAVAGDIAERRVKRVYVAAVRVARDLPDRARLEHRLEHHRGTTRVVQRGGKRAVTELRVLQRNADRALLELRPETGRTHQLRVQLAALGAPIVGDDSYGGEPAERLLLHAHQLELPSLQRSFAAELPRAFAAWVDGAGSSFAFAEPEECRRRLRDAACARWPLAAGNSVFRLVHGAADGLPGAIVDRYGEHVVLSLSEPAAAEAEAALAALLVELGALGVYVKRRRRTDLRKADAVELAPPEPIAGSAAPDEHVVHEGARRYRVALGEGLSTGLFVDQRDNRDRIADLCRGKRLLNLFSYTCSFTVAAALGGAAHTTSVDLARTALATGAANLELNGASGPQHRLLRADALSWLERAGRRGERFDVVVLDPPSFGTRGKRTFAVSSDYGRAAALALAVVEPGGWLLAVTNHRKTSRGALRRTLSEAARSVGLSVKLRDLAPPLDCPPWPGGDEPTKAVLVEVS